MIYKMINLYFKCQDKKLTTTNFPLCRSQLSYEHILIYKFYLKNSPNSKQFSLGNLIPSEISSLSTTLALTERHIFPRWKDVFIGWTNYLIHVYELLHTVCAPSYYTCNSEYRSVKL